MIRQIILILFIILSAFIYYSGKIIDNKTYFNTDEAYWISTAKIVPLLLEHKFKDPSWKEYYGFVNFNGAKFIYGIGLRFFGINDVSLVGNAPETYYRWKPFDGKLIPKTNPLYRIIIKARLISAFFASIAVGLMYIFVFRISRKVLSSFIAASIALVHPITIHIATHALSDSFFIFFQMILLILIILLAKTQVNFPRSKSIFLATAIGFTLAWLMSIKLNGAMFLGISVVFLALNIDYSFKAIKKVFFLFCIMCMSTLTFFLLLEPNLFFYPQYSFFQMLADRILITNQHITYFLRINPNHVILSIPARIHSFTISMFPLWLWPLFLVGTVCTFILFFSNRLNFMEKIYRPLVATGLLTWGIVLTYVVFDEPRYFLPLLPFVILVSVSWINYLNIFSRPILQSFSHMRKLDNVITS